MWLWRIEVCRSAKLNGRRIYPVGASASSLFQIKRQLRQAFGKRPGVASGDLKKAC